MYRIDNPTALPSLPIAGPPGTPGFFSEGHRPTGVEATIVDAWWANLVQEEILTVITQAGLTPNKASHTQLFEALQTLFMGGGAAFLPLAGGEMTGFPLLLARYPELNMEAAPKGYVDALFAGVPPDMAGLYLPITGGTLYQPGGGYPLTIRTNAGQQARIRYNVDGLGQWNMGLNGNNGLFGINDEAAAPNTARLSIDQAGLVRVYEHLQVEGNVTAEGVYAHGITAADFGFTTTGNIALHGSITERGGVLTLWDQPYNIYFGCWASVGRWRFGTVNQVGEPLSEYLTLWPGEVQIIGNLAVTGNLAAAGRIDGQVIDITGGATFRSGVFILSGNLEIAAGSLAVGNYARIDGGASVANGLSIPSGNVQISSGNLNVGGNSYAIAHIDTSDRRLKEQLSDYRRGLEAVRQFNPQSWQWRDRLAAETERSYGLVADDVEMVAPEMVSEFQDTKGIHLMPLICTLVNAVQELATRLEALETA
ncbi:MAG TPA: tail fiber domain-containing protein [Xanthobacteraceae bacterium]|nr:tail fiber domain-containing protein [Xanthobacteraceae bacterium]